MHPVDPVTVREAAKILGCAGSTVQHFVATGRLQAGDRYERKVLSRARVEQLACEVYDWRRHALEHDETSYWVTGQRAADVLGVNRSRLGQLAHTDRLPYMLFEDGTRLFRRQQLEVLARARASKPRSGTRAW